MTKTRSTKRALLLSTLSLLMCISMLVGSTFAWFTDSVTSAGNQIVSGKLEIALEYSVDGINWEDAEGKTLNFKTADGRAAEEILWEPGCTYVLPAIRVRNNGNLALKYQIVINGVTGNAKLLEAIDFTANEKAITTYIGHLDTKDAVSESIVIKGHMKEEAGNEYQGLQMDGISITVYATQYTYENDSFGNKYDVIGQDIYPNGTMRYDCINSGRTMGNNGRYQIAADITNVSGVKTLAVNVLDQNGKLMTTITPETYSIPADGKITSVTVAAVVVGNSSSWQNTPFFPTTNSVPTIMELVVNGAVIGVTNVKPIANASPATWEEIVDAYYAANDVTVIDSTEELASSLKTAASAGAGDSTLVLSDDIDMTGSSWTPINVDGYHGAGVITVEGNGATIKGLNAPLFAGGFAGKSGIVIKDLTIADSNIVGGTQGGGAFIDCADSMQVLTLENCHLVNSTVTGERAGGLIGWCSGYAKDNDGPVKTKVTISNCSVVDSTVIGNGSAGGIAGHPGASDYTYTTIENCVIKNVKVISHEPVSSWRTGAIVGTANNGHIVINNVAVEDVTLTQDGVTASETKLYGRFVPSGTGTLVIDGVEIN